jgi:hypothetical protein
MFPLFTAPWAFAALAALPALAALYWLRNSYRRLPVSSLMLWLEQAESRASGLRVRRLHTPLLFFLELAALMLLAVAATGPRLEIWQGRWPLVVVLDDSYSMLAGGDHSPRRLAREFIEDELSWGAAAGVRFVLAGPTPQTLGDAAHSSREIRETLNDWRCQAPTAKLAEAVTLAAEIGGPTARLLVLTDHAPPSEPEPGRLSWHAFGASLANRAFIRAARTAGEAKDRIHLEIANFAPDPHTGALVLEAGTPAQEVHRERLELAPRETRRLALQVPRDVSVLTGRLDADMLPIDDVAYLAREEAPPVRVEMRIADEPLRALVDRTLAATGRTVPASSKPQLLFTDAFEAPAVAPDTWIVQLLQEKDAEPYLGPFVVDRNHPLTEGVSFAGIVWGAGKTKEQPGAPVLLAGNVPLITDTETLAGQHRIRVRLRPDLSTFTESPAWPALVWNLLDWRAAQQPGLRRANLRLGESALLSLAAGIDKVTLLAPSPPARSLPVHAQRVSVRPTDVGVHVLQAAEASYLFAVSTQSREESDLSANVTGQWGEWLDDDVTSPATYNLAWILLLVVLGILTAHMILAVRGRSR